MDLPQIAKSYPFFSTGLPPFLYLASASKGVNFEGAFNPTKKRGTVCLGLHLPIPQADPPMNFNRLTSPIVSLNLESLLKTRKTGQMLQNPIFSLAMYIFFKIWWSLKNLMHSSPRTIPFPWCSCYFSVGPSGLQVSCVTDSGRSFQMLPGDHLAFGVGDCGGQRFLVFGDMWKIMSIHVGDFWNGLMKLDWNFGSLTWYWWKWIIQIEF